MRLGDKKGRRPQTNRQQSSNVIVDDYQSQGYGVDSEMDAQDFINDLGDAQSAIFIEGDSEYAGEHDTSMQGIKEHEDEFNNSMDNRRSTYRKRHKSMDFDEDEEDKTSESDLKPLKKNPSEIKKDNGLGLNSGR